MKSGHGRLTLHNGTDLSLEYRLVHPPSGFRCQGTLIGDLTSLDPGIYAQRLKFVSSDGTKLALLVTNYSDRHLTFIGDLEGVPPSSDTNSQSLSQDLQENL